MKKYLISSLKRAQNIIENPILLNAKLKRVNTSFVKDLITVKKIVNGDLKTIFDVGAAHGEYTKAAHFLNPNANIYAFEPIPASFEKLKLLVHDNRRIKLFNFALGSENKEAIFEQKDFSFSSSLLPMTDTHKEMFPFTKHGKVITIDVKRLDNIKEIEITRPSLLKMDVQGYELEVLIGASSLIDNFDVVQLEINFENFYEGQANYVDLFRFMYEHKFKRFLQTDKLYLSNNLLVASDLIFSK